MGLRRSRKYSCMILGAKSFRTEHLARFARVLRKKCARMYYYIHTWIIVPDCRFQKSLSIFAAEWAHYFQTWHLAIPSAEILRMLGSNPSSSPIWTSENHRNVYLHVINTSMPKST